MRQLAGRTLRNAQQRPTAAHTHFLTTGLTTRNQHVSAYKCDGDHMV